MKAHAQADRFLEKDRCGPYGYSDEETSARGEGGSTLRVWRRWRQVGAADDVGNRLQSLLADARWQRAGLLVLLWVPAVALLIAVREVLLPFLLAFALAYVIAPPVRWISSRTIRGRPIPRWLAVIVLYVGFFVVLGGSGRIFIPQLYKELSRLAGDATAAYHQISDDAIAKQARELERFIQEREWPIHIATAEDEDAVSGDVSDGALSVGPAVPSGPSMSASPPRPTGSVADGRLTIDAVGAVQDLIRNAKQLARERALLAMTQLQAIVGGTVRFIFSTFLVLMLAAFIVADVDRIANFIFTITPIRDRERLRLLIGRIDRGLGGVVRGQLTICVINGLLTLVGLLLLKVKFAFLLGTIAAIFSLIPIFGSILSTIPIVIVAMSSGLSTAVLAVMWIVGIHALEANLLNPKIMGDAAKIHPILVILALVVGEHFYGLAGALFAVPLMSVLLTLWQAVRSKAMSLDADIAIAELTHQGPPRPHRTQRRRIRDAGG
jgi:predicted PurR-regulated permease PerM